MNSRLSIVIALLLLFSARPAEAQLRRVLELNRQAMDAYLNLEVEDAMDALNQALEAARRGNVTGSQLARTHANMGIVAVGGFGDNSAGLQHFVDAIEADPNVELDPLSSTPDIQSVFTLARSRAGGGSTNNNNTNNGEVIEIQRPTGPGQIPHRPVTEQLNNTALPIFVDVPGNASVGGISVFYKAPGMRDFRQVEMRRMEGGYGLELPCAEIMAPLVSYYVVARDEDGETMGTAGDAETPFSVQIVSQRSMPPPALPGAPPPEQCTDTECPPGMSGCSDGGTAGLGDTCVTSQDCRSGLSCEDNFCIAGDFEEPGETDDGDMPRFFLDAGFSLGLGYATSGGSADSAPPAGSSITESQYASYQDNTHPDCDALDGQFCVRLEQPGFLLAYALRFTVGYWIIPRIAAAATIRFQLDAGQGSFSNLLIGLRVMYQVTQPAAEGLNANVFLGTSYGQIQLKPPQNGAEEPYIISGLNGIQIGANVGYRFMRNVGVTFTPEIHLLFPKFLFNIDLTAAVSVGF